MRQLTPAELKELDHIQEMIQRNTDNGIIKHIVSIVISAAKNEMWLNILELAKAQSEGLKTDESQRLPPEWQSLTAKNTPENKSVGL